MIFGIKWMKSSFSPSPVSVSVIIAVRLVSLALMEIIKVTEDANEWTVGQETLKSPLTLLINPQTGRQKRV